jgi:hypothetical protein
MNKTLPIIISFLLILSLSSTAILYYHSPYEPYEDGHRVMYFTCSDGVSQMIWANQCVYFKELYYSAKSYCNQRDNSGYRNTYFQCYDGYTRQYDSCMQQSFINQLRDWICVDHCLNGKCGVNTYKRGNECSGQNNVERYTLGNSCQNSTR